jgi:hypothetical protein
MFYKIIQATAYTWPNKDSDWWTADSVLYCFGINQRSLPHTDSNEARYSFINNKGQIAGLVLGKEDGVIPWQID